MKSKLPKSRLNTVADIFAQATKDKKNPMGKKVTPPEGDPEDVEPGSDIESEIEDAQEQSAKSKKPKKHPFGRK